MGAYPKGILKKIAPYVALALLLTFSYTAWRLYERNVRQREESRFLHSVNHVTNEIVDRFYRYEMVLQGGAGLFAASEEVTRQEWQAYCEYQQTVDLYPGVQGVGYAEVVLAGDLTRYIATIRAEGYPDYTVWPGGERENYAAVTYIEPFNEENQKVLGFDLLSEEVHQVAAERARDDDSASISGKLTLASNDEEDSQPGFMMFLPVYRKGLPHNTVEERRIALEGYIFAPFQMDVLMENIFHDPLYTIGVAIYDGTEMASTALLYDSLNLEEEHRPLFSSQSVVDLYGHQWTIISKTTPHFEASPDHFVGYGVLTGGLLFSFLLFFYFRTLENNVDKARLFYQVLQESEEKYRFLVDHSDELIWILKNDGVFSYASPSWQKVLGYKSSHLEGQAFQLFLHPEDAVVYGNILAEVFKTGGVIDGLQYRVKYADELYHWHEGSIKTVYGNDENLKYYIGISRDITKRKSVEDEIRTLNDELEKRVLERTAEVEAANKELEAFSYSVSHDLRTPLRAIDGFSERLIASYSDQLDEKGKHYLKRIRRAVFYMGNLIDDLLKLSRIARVELSRSSVSLSELADEVLVSLQEAEPDRHVEAVIVANLEANGDFRLLRVVLENLLDNALKFSAGERQSRIELGSIDRGYRKVFFVRDNGVGFNMAYADKLFGAFQRLHGLDEFPGTGIGLATVQRIINRHGGSIWAESEEGKGATFFFTL